LEKKNGKEEIAQHASQNGQELHDQNKKKSYAGWKGIKTGGELVPGEEVYRRIEKGTKASNPSQGVNDVRGVFPRGMRKKDHKEDRVERGGKNTGAP